MLDWNNTKRDYPQDRCIHELFEKQVERTPEAVAVVFEDDQLTYIELNRRANQVAHYLQKQGVGPEVLVGICVERSIEMVVGLLGILKAGGAYVPFDPEYPKERLAFMLEDTRVPVILTQERLVKGLPGNESRVITLDRDWKAISGENEENPTSGVTADNLAYVIFTSGSTGKPKGVLLEHRGLCNVSSMQIRTFNINSNSRVLQFSSLSFDAMTFEIVMALSGGGTLCLAAKESLLPGEALIRLLRELSITIITIPPSPLAVLPTEDLPALHTICVAGEACSAELVARWASGSRFFNLYGPTEATIWSTVAECIDNGERPSIGHPIDNTQIYILDHQLQPVPVGVAGELHISGAGIARGYQNRPDLTAEKFIPNPFSREPGERLYKSGDLARYLSDGNIEFLGRIDQQVKIRGFRIELGEIETVLGKHPAIRNNVVLDKEIADGDKRLVAYIVPNSEKGPAPTTGELRCFLNKTLPGYMVPSAFVLLDALPLTPNGKVDRKALPMPDFSRSGLDQTFVAPHSPVEQILTEIWEGLLGLERVGIHHNFFDLGGNSLLASQLISRVRDALQVELSVQSIFNTPTVANLAEIIEKAIHGSSELQVPSIEPVSRDVHLPLSFSQERVWFIQQLHPENIAYNVQVLFELEGVLDIAALQRSLSEIIRRHEILRTTFPAIDGKPVQVIHKPQTVDLPIVDLQSFSDGEREAEMQRLINKEFERSFHLTQLPLIRWTLLRVSPRKYTLVHVEHHLVHDGWSFNVFLHELLELYKAFSTGKPSPLPELPIQFVDFAYWQRSWVQGDIEETQLNYWKEKLAGIPTELRLPFNHPRPAMQTFRGEAIRLNLPLDLSESLISLSRKEATTLFMTMQAAFVILMNRYSMQDDICIGSGVANRRRHETEGLIGMIINNIVLRTDLSGNPSFRELLRRVRNVTLEAYANQDVPFDKVVKALQPHRETSRNPLIQVMFSFHNSRLPDLKLPELTIELLEGLSNGSAKFDMNVFVIPRSEQRVGMSRSNKEEFKGITVVWEYNTDLFDKSTITRMVDHYQALLKGIVADPEQRISDLPLLSEAERMRLLVEWNNTQSDYPRNRCVHELFEEQAELTPDAIAVLFEDRQMIYRELNLRANQLAHHLQKLGVEREVLVGICMERSVEMVVGLLGILKAGGAYVPLDSEYPKERLAFMLEDTRVPVLLTQERFVEGLPENGARVVCLDSDREIISGESESNLSSTTTPDNLAYVMYTSGSTGRPKGICIPHRGVVRLVKETDYADLTAEETFLQFAPISFDASTFEIWGCLLNGARLVVFPGPTPSLEEFGRVLQQYRVTTLWLTAGLFHQMVENHTESLRHVRQLLAGGDVLSVSHVKKALGEIDGCRLINGYGPTENTTFTCCYSMTDPGQVGISVPIGRPISNTRVYVLDQRLQPVPIGVYGELYIGGDGLARNYLNRPELTAEKFIPNPFSDEPGKRLYKTGDLARYLHDGNIEFLGRMDHQVKIRGFRIEPGEIEAVLGQHPAVRETVVLAREDVPGEKRLVSYVVPRQEQAPATSELRSFLRDKLPDYMMPSSFMFLDSMPLTPNGKVDRKALPVPDGTRPETESRFVAPRTPVEEVLAGIWSEMLGLEQVGVYDNFFDLGGHSLQATQIISRVRDTLKVELPLRCLFEAPTVSGLSNSINKARESGSELQAPAISPVSRESHKGFPK